MRRLFLIAVVMALAIIVVPAFGATVDCPCAPVEARVQQVRGPQGQRGEVGLSGPTGPRGERGQAGEVPSWYLPAGILLGLIAGFVGGLAGANYGGHHHHPAQAPAPVAPAPQTPPAPAPVAPHTQNNFYGPVYETRGNAGRRRETPTT